MKKRVLAVFSIFALILALGLAYVFFVVARQNPNGAFDYKNINAILSSESEVFYRDGKNKFGAFFSEDHRFYVRYDSLPQSLIDAVIAAEDANFFKHHGFDARGIARAVRNNFSSGRFSQGGSTITQQTVKNLFGRKRQSLAAKAREFADALRLEHRYKKHEILEFYLNQFHVVGNGKGIGVASVYFFNKSISDLSLEESAFIAGILKAPSDAEKNMAGRTRYVLRRMLETGKITKERHDAAKIPEINRGEFRMTEYSAMLSEIEKAFHSPYFKLLFDSVGVDDWRTDGLTIITTLDKSAQEIAQKSVQKNLLGLQKQLAADDSLQGGLAAIRRGELLAAWSGQSNTGWFNRVFEAERQFGSAWKPLSYALALRLGWEAGDSLENEYDLFYYKDSYYFPRSDSKGHPTVSVEQALARSENVASIWLLTHALDKLSDEDVWKLAERHSMGSGSISRDMADEIAFERAKAGMLNDWRVDRRALQALHYGKNYEREVGAQKKHPDRVRLLNHNYRRYLTLSPDKYDDDYKLFTNFSYADFKMLRDLAVDERREKVLPRDILMLPEFRIALALKEFSAFCKDIGIRNGRDLKELLNVPFGVNEATVAEMVSAYSSIVSGKIYKCKYGEWGEPCVIHEIRNLHGEVIYRSEIASKEAVPEGVAEQMREMLAGVFSSGTGRAYARRALTINAVGKTGTSNENRTVAFFGTFENDGLTTVGSYVGFDDNQKMKNKSISVTGSNGALPQWIDFSEGASRLK